MISVKTSNGVILKGEELENILKVVSKDLIDTAYAVYNGNYYASHITEENKKEFLNKSIEYAREVELGKHNNNFTFWQRMNYIHTGNCIPFMTWKVLMVYQKGLYDYIMVRSWRDYY